MSSAWPSPLQLAANVPRQLCAAAASLVFKILFLEQQSLPAAKTVCSFASHTGRESFLFQQLMLRNYYRQK